LDNRVQRFGLMMLSLPQDSQAKEVVGAGSEIRKRLENALGYSGRTETSEWKAQQKILWTEVKKETGRWKSRW
jgi:hypothetical protein